MDENFLSVLKRIAPLSEQSLTELTKYCTKKSFAKEEFVLKEHDVCNDIYFVSKGLLRIYYYKFRNGLHLKILFVFQ